MLSHATIEQAARCLVRNAQSPAQVILFGSYARGEATEDSDLDLLVVEQELPDPTSEYLRLRRALGSLGVGVDLLLYSKNEFERRRDWCGTPIYWAVREGRILHESTAG